MIVWLARGGTSEREGYERASRPGSENSKPQRLLSHSTHVTCMRQAQREGESEE